MNKARKNDYLKLVKDYGENGELFTFNLCSDYGVELAGSTIDKIEVSADENIRFYFNENTNDYVSFEYVSDEDLRTFYNGIKEALWEKNGMSEEQIDIVYEEIRKKFKSIFSDVRDLDEFMDNFYESVVDDINETADWSDYDKDEICLDDVEMAIVRELKEAVA